MRMRAAWLYYMEGLTQEEVAKRLQISRLKTLRILAACREEGIVQIRINGRQASQVAIEKSLEGLLGIENAVVVPTPEDETKLAEVIGQAAGAYLSGEIRDGVSIGVGWGGTLQHSLRSLEWTEVEKMTVVSMLGGMTHAISFNPSAFAFKFADLYRAECYHLTTPVFVSSKELRNQLWREPSLQEIVRRSQKVDVAAISVGDMSPGATLFRSGLLSEAERKELRAAGAIGDILCHFVDEKGGLVDHPLNSRVMAFNPMDLRKIGKVVVVAGGKSKVDIIMTAVRLTGARTLITDERTARGIVDRLGGG
ncbi:MAG: sugar-binding transcriptional regulator [Rhodospirillales bacterium]|nr:sugar-binding transcriptional regulator [Rhodospirillales bacterium]